MTPPAGFVNYPNPVEGPAGEYNPKPGRNPILRGLPLVVASQLISRSAYVQRFFWANAGFGAIKDMPELDDMPATFHPVVTPLGETGPMLEFGPELTEARRADSPARYYSAAHYHALYRSGKTTPLQVAEALLAVTRPGARYADAWADSHGRDHLAIAAARAATERYAAGKPLGILDGVPIGVKDDVDVECYVNHFGLEYNARVPWFKPQTKSAWPVRMLQDAGAVVIGKLRMHELGSDTNGLNVAQGTPRNHHNLAYYPGGSSSGPASATCAGLVPITVATDAGGSVRIPASFNGLYGLKTSHARTMHMDSTMCVTGPLAANAADLAIAYRVMSQPDPHCPQHPGLLIMTPTTPLAGWPRLDGDDAYGLSDGNLTFRNMMFVFLANMTGTPSVSAPVAYVDPAQGHGKLPVGLMATAEWGSEEQLLAWAAEAEDYLHDAYPDGRKRPDAWVDVMELARESKAA